MPESKLIVPQTYADLKKAVSVAMIEGQRAVEQTKLRTYHETGRLIDGHLLLFKARADYGAQLIPRLAHDFDLDESVLYRCLRFVRYFPILAARQELTWAHYRVLCQVTDAAQRKALTKEAVRNEWTSRELEARVAAINVAGREISAPVPGDPVAAKPIPLTPKRGTPGVCKLIAVGEGTVVDLGFACYLDLVLRPGAGQTDDRGLKPGAFVRLDAAGRATLEPAATKADLFTYRAEILKVVDGDTLWVKVYLEPRRWVKQKLRLRDLDCPELPTSEGKAAKRFVDTLLTSAEGVTICTTKPDKYDRYLADVFLQVAGAATGSTGSLQAGTGQAEEIFLNNALLQNGHAVRKGAYAPADWEG
ncbi:MAG: thermonuclease family protein [Opitutaceae bacterium]|nr:thermonuclease family protein [Opitutaceae bacterium]MBP9912061.1 thermonuclease family protein [Opitutaceae bacterium]